MILVDTLLAVALLTAAPDSVELPDPAAAFTAAAPTLKALALEWELLDPRESDYLRNPQDFASDDDFSSQDDSDYT